MASRQFYQAAAAEGESSTTSGTPQTKSTLTFTPDANSTYLIIATALVRSDVSSSGESCYARLYNNTSSTVLGETRTESKDDTDYSTTGFAVYETFGSSPVSQTYYLQYYRGGTAATAYIKFARLVAIKLTSNDKVNSSVGASTYNTDTTYQNKVTLTFTPATAGDYLLIGSATVYSTGGTSDVLARINVDGSTYYGVQNLEPIFNGALSRFPYLFFQKVTLTAAEHNIYLQYATESTSQSAGIQYAYMIALRIDDFPGTLIYGEQDSIQTDTDAVQDHALTVSFSAAKETDYLILASCIYDRCNSTSYSGSVGLYEGTTNLGMTIQEPKDTTSWQIAQWIYLKDYPTGNWYIDLLAESASYDARADDLRLYGLQLTDIAKSTTKGLAYKVKSTPSATQKALAYKVKTLPSAYQRTLAYKVKTYPSAITKAMAYVVEGITTPTYQRTLAYKVNTSPSAYTRPLAYKAKFVPSTIQKGMAYVVQVVTYQTVQKTMVYRIKYTPTTIEKTLLYKIKYSPSTLQKALVYTVPSYPAAITKTLTYRVLTIPSEVTKSLVYRVKTFPSTVQKDMDYEVELASEWPTIQKGLVYRVKITPSAIQKSLAYKVNSTPSTVQKGLDYCVPSTQTYQRTLAYKVAKSYTIQKSLAYKVFLTPSIQKGMVYRVPKWYSITKDLDYFVKLPTSPIQKDLDYSVKSTSSIQKGLIYLVKTTPASITKDLDYLVKTSPTETVKTLVYLVLTTTTIEKGMEYDVEEASAWYNIQKSLVYRVKTVPAAITKSLVYDVTSPGVKIEKALKYCVPSFKSKTKDMDYAVSTLPALVIDAYESTGEKITIGWCP